MERRPDSMIPRGFSLRMEAKTGTRFLSLRRPTMSRSAFYDALWMERGLDRRKRSKGFDVLIT